MVGCRYKACVVPMLDTGGHTPRGTMNQKSLQNIQIDAGDDGSQVVFTPQDQDKFVLGCKDAIRCAQVGLGWNAIGDEIRALIEHVHQWFNKHSGIAKCHVRPVDGRLVVYVVPKKGRFDLELSDQLTDLDLEISQRFQNVFCDVLQSPIVKDESPVNAE